MRNRTHGYTITWEIQEFGYNEEQKQNARMPRLCVDVRTRQLRILSLEAQCTVCGANVSFFFPTAAEMLERGPPLWPAVYPSAGSSLQHAHQLQLLSHQQLVRQQELYMIQQQAAQVMELQRNAQFVVGNENLFCWTSQPSAWGGTYSAREMQILL